MKKVQVAIMAVMLATLPGYSATLLSVDFESDTAGSQPVATYVNPIPNTADNFVTVVNSAANPAGTGQGVRLYDNSAAVGTRLGYDFSTGESVIRYDVSFSQLNDTGTANRAFSICVTANGVNGTASAERYAEARITDDGDIRWYQNGTLFGQLSNYQTPGTAYTLSMYVNDGDSAVLYNSGANTLAANSVDFWVDGIYQTTCTLGTVSAGTTNGLGRVGIISGTSDVLMDYAFDNIKVSTIEPPSESGSVSLFLLGE